MEKNKYNQEYMDKSVPKTSALDLMGRQSVRATFRLSEDSIDAISILSVLLGIKQKSVFDHLLEDAKVLKHMASELENKEFDRHERIQKTFVISRRSLSYLNTISSRHNTPRDALVEYSVRRLLPIIARERQKHEKRKELFTDISKHFAEGEKLLSKTEKILGLDDLIATKLQSAISAYKNALDDIAHFINKGKIIEEFQSE